MADGAIAIFERERRHQVYDLGYSLAHDVHERADGSLASAAVCYANVAFGQASGLLTADDDINEVPSDWPWDAESWRPEKLAKNNLRKAGAMLAAEWDRLDAIGM